MLHIPYGLEVIPSLLGKPAIFAFAKCQDLLIDPTYDILRKVIHGSLRARYRLSDKQRLNDAWFIHLCMRNTYNPQFQETEQRLDQASGREGSVWN